MIVYLDEKDNRFFLMVKRKNRVAKPRSSAVVLKKNARPGVQ